jgi:tetratricopeptide (TPR) repeat protein
MNRLPQKTASEEKITFSPLPFSSPQNKRWKILTLSLGLALLVALIFGQTLGHGFVNYDDDLYVYENSHVLHGLTLSNMAWAFVHSHAANWHPLTWLSHMLDVELYGLNPSGHHLTSVLFHALNAVLLFWLLRQLTDSLWPSFFAAAFFAVHPLRVESVAWIAERKDVLSGFFFLLTLLAYVRYARLPWSPWRYALVFFLFAAGLMAKPMLVTLPLILLLLDFWPLHRLAPKKSESAFHWKSFALSRRTILEKIPLLILVLGSCVATLLAQQEAIRSFTDYSLGLRMANAANSYFVYLKQTVYPVELAIFYPYSAKYLHPANVSFAVFVLIFLSSAVWALRRQYPFLIIGWAWYLLTLVPVIGIVQVGSQAHANRYTYLPQIGLVMAFVWLAAHLKNAWFGGRWKQGIVALAILLIFSCLAYRETSQWSSNENLWRRTLAHTSPNAIAHNNLGMLLIESGKVDESLAHFQRAVEIDPKDPKALVNFGSVLPLVGRNQEAISAYQKALKINPLDQVTYFNLGLSLAMEGREEEAIAAYQKALEIDSAFKEAYGNLGILYSQKGDISQAFSCYLKALEIDPQFVLALNNLAWILAAHPESVFRNGPQAVAHAEKANLLSGSKNPEILKTLAAAYAETGRFAEAIRTARAAIALTQVHGASTILQKQLALYQQGHPWREPRASAGK